MKAGKLFGIGCDGAADAERRPDVAGRSCTMVLRGQEYHLPRLTRSFPLEENGERRSAARLFNAFEEIERFFRSVGEPCRVVLEARWNWRVAGGLREYTINYCQGPAVV